MDIIRDVLDNQIIDRNQRKIGKVDGIVVEIVSGQPPKLAYIEVGMPILARRLQPRWGRWAAAIAQKWGLRHNQPFRIPWSKVLNVGIDVDVDLEAADTPALDYENWLREHIIKHIPGSG